MDNEVWKDIEGFEGKYAVSNLGNVKSLNYRHTGKEKILSPFKTWKGYLRVNLCRNGKRKNYAVHRLVLSTFNPVDDSESLQVNHIDEDKSNNRLENLEWMTCKENNNYGTHNDRVAEKTTNGKLSIPLVQLTIEGRYIRSYKSAMDAKRLGGFHQGAIIKCCKGKRKSHGGFRWMYLSEYMDKNNGLLID